MASLSHLLYFRVSGATIVELSQAFIWFSRLQWSEMADFKFSCFALFFCPRVTQSVICLLHSFWCCFFVGSKISLTLRWIFYCKFYMGFHKLCCIYLSGCILSLVCTSNCLKFVCGLMIVTVFCFLLARIDSVTPLTYSIVIMFLNWLSIFPAVFFSVTVSFVCFLFAVYLSLLPNSDIGSFLKLLLCVVLLIVCLPCPCDHVCSFK